MKTNVYVVKDVIADDIIILGMAKTDGLFVRQNAQFFSRMNLNFLDDYKIFCIGQFVDSTLKIENLTEARPVSWDSYKHPETVVTSAECSLK